MKKIKSIFYIAVIFTFIFSSCNESKDLFTANVKEGGLVQVTNTSIPYKLNVTPSFDINFVVPMGPEIKEIKVYKTFSGEIGNSAKVLQSAIAINGTNSSKELDQKLSLTYADLIKDIKVDGASLPTDETDLAIGDSWTFEFVSVMAEDSREVINNSKSLVSVANFYAGSYNVSLKYFHPTAGGSYPDDPYGGVRALEKDLIATNSTDCKLPFAVWGPAEEMTIQIIDNVPTIKSVVEWSYDVIAGDPYDATKISSYDPETGIITLYYHYYGTGGPRIFWEVLTPAN